MHIATLIRISRPRFWGYTVGPYLLGVAATGWLSSFVPDGSLGYVSFTADRRIFLPFLCFLFLFLFPYNLFIYGVNDIADGDTDKLNTKKDLYEQRLEYSQTRQLLRAIGAWNVPFLLLSLLLLVFVYGAFWSVASWIIVILLLLAYSSAAGYSLPPVRAKARPFLDGVFNVLYILPGLVGYVAYGGQWSEIAWPFFIAGWLWCMAMHAYSAIPDIEPDTQAGLATTATVLGKKGTLLYCLFLYSITGLIIGSYFPFVGAVLYSVYCILIAFSFFFPVFRVYKIFPFINMVVGCALFRGVVWIHSLV